MLSNKTFEKTIVHGENLGTSTTTDRLNPYREYLEPWTKLKSSQSFQDLNFALTGLNIHNRLITKNPLIEIEYQIIDTIRLKPYREYLEPWTKLKSSQSFQDLNFALTDLNIHNRLITENPLIEIEYQIIDTIGTEFDEDLDNNQYESNLYGIITLYDSLAIFVISNLLDTQRIKFLQAIQLLRFIGKIRHMPTYQDRTWLLVKNLSALSKYVRDGASLGLLYLENPSTINALKEAIEREPSKQLRENMLQVLRGLENKVNVASITENSK